jgi:hypothetical protein
MAAPVTKSIWDKEVAKTADFEERENPSKSAK